MLKGKTLYSFGSRIPDLDLITLLMAYLIIRVGRNGVAFFAFGQGLLIDLFSGGEMGLFTTIYLLVFWGLYGGGLFFNLDNTRGRIVLVALSALLGKVMFAAALRVLTGISVGGLWAARACAGVFLTGLVTPMLFYLLDQATGIRAQSTSGEMAERE